MISGLIQQFCDALTSFIPFEQLTGVIGSFCEQLVSLFEGIGL